MLPAIICPFLNPHKYLCVAFKNENDSFKPMPTDFGALLGNLIFRLVLNVYGRRWALIFIESYAWAQQKQ